MAERFGPVRLSEAQREIVTRVLATATPVVVTTRGAEMADQSDTRRRAVLVDGDEQDAVTSWHHVLCCMGRPGRRAAVKRKIRRRERRQGKEECNGIVD